MILHLKNAGIMTKFYSILEFCRKNFGEIWVEFHQFFHLGISNIWISNFQVHL